VSEDDEIEALRRRRLTDLKRRLGQEQDRARQQEQLEVQKQAILRRILTTEARQRLANLKMVKPEFSEQLELQLIQLAQTGRLQIPVSDEQLKDILARLQSQRRDITIRRR
jgi:programmed cell death protein 5